MRHIDADKLILHLNDYKLQVSPNWKDEWERMVSCLVIDTCMDAVKEQPTADVVEVIRCKNCIYKEECGREVLVNEYDDDKAVDITGFLFYCSYGEREK